MRRNVFLSVLFPFLLLLISISTLFLVLQEHYAVSITKLTLRNAFNLLKSDCEYTVSNYVDYEKRIQNRVANYRFGNIFYAWLLKSDGTEVTVSAYKKRIEPTALKDNSKLFSPHIKKQGADCLKLSTGGNIKIIEYAPVSGTDFILAVIADIPEGSMPVYAYRPLLIISLALILLAGVISSSWISKRLFATLNSLISYASLLNNGEEPEMPVFNEYNLDSIVYFMKELANRSVVYVDEDRNPITHIHGVAHLENRLFDEIDAKKPFAVCEVAVSNFQPYLTRYGKSKTNSLTRFIAMIVSNAVEEDGNDNDLVIHVANDRFVIVTTPLKSAAICEHIIENFRANINAFYDKSDVEKGCILSKDKEGSIGSYALARILIGVSTNTHIPLIHPLQIAHITGEIICYLAKGKESAYLIDRRTLDRTPYAPAFDNISNTSEMSTESSGEQTPTSLADDPEFRKRVEELEKSTTTGRKRKKKYSEVIRSSSLKDVK